MGIKIVIIFKDIVTILANFYLFMTTISFSMKPFRWYLEENKNMPSSGPIAKWQFSRKLFSSSD
jgi:hypothetical protein